MCPVMIPLRGYRGAAQQRGRAYVVPTGEGVKDQPVPMITY